MRALLHPVPILALSDSLAESSVSSSSPTCIHVQFDPECEADRMMLIKAILHAADIGNAVRPFAVNDAMSKR